MASALAGDRDPAAVAAMYEAAISGGLPQDDEMVARFFLAEQYRQIVARMASSGLSEQQCVASSRFADAVSQTVEALRLDREGRYGYFAEPLNRACLKDFDLLCCLGADAIFERGDRSGAIAYLEKKMDACAYLTSCPLLNAMRKLAALHVLDGTKWRAIMYFRRIVDAEPVDRLDEQGAEKAIRDDARDGLSRLL